MHRLMLVFVALFFVSCNFATLTGISMPKPDQQGKSFFVRHQPKDKRGLDKVLADSLRSQGFEVVGDPSASPDYVLNYIDKWYWDMRTYMVDIRDAETNMLVGTGRSFQASIDAMGHSYAEIAESALELALDGNKKHVNMR